MNSPASELRCLSVAVHNFAVFMHEEAEPTIRQTAANQWYLKYIPQNSNLYMIRQGNLTVSK
jgi:hypothetical protein